MPSLPRLYAILDVDALSARGLEPAAVLRAWLDAGIRLIQLRAKHLGSGALVELADTMLAMTRPAGAMLIINDRADVALLVGADGVHVGQSDLSPAQVRDIAERDGRVEPFLIGISTHDLAQISEALNGPADHLAIGPVFPTATKADADSAVGLAMVAEAALAVGDRPLVAIGGITLVNAPAVLAAGATSVAVISDLLVGDIGRRAREFVAICQ